MSTEINTEAENAATTEVQTSTETTADVTTEVIQTQEAVTTESDLDDEKVVSYFRSKGREIESIDKLFEKPEVVENPYASVIEDAEVKSFLDYKKETGRSFADYQKLQSSVDDISLLDLAIGKARKDIGGNVSNEDLTEYIQEELNIDLSDMDELSTAEKLKLTKFVKEYKAELAAEHEKYKTPIAINKTVTEQEEMITLEGGQKMRKADYDEHQKIRQTYLENTKAAVDSVAKTSLNIEFDNNGTKEVLTYDYEFDSEDKKVMLSMSEDLDQTVGKLFRTDKGFDHEGFAKAVYRLNPKNWEKEVSAIVHKARAEAIEEFTRTGNNVNYAPNALQSQQKVKEGVRMVPLKELLNR